MNNPYEKNSLTDRFKELGILIFFIALSLITSIIVMNITIFPIAVFAIKQKIFFTHLVVNLIWILVLAACLYYLIRRIIFYKKNGIGNLQIFKIILSKPLMFMLLFIVILLIIITLVLIIYFLLNNNYYLLYKILNLK
jgi:hypothetical protein